MRETRRLPTIAALLAAVVLVVLSGCANKNANNLAEAAPTPTPNGENVSKEPQQDPVEEEPVAGEANDELSLEKIEKTDEEWREQLTDEQFRVARKEGTERAFTGKYWDNKADGVYACVCCGLPLFPSDTKYESGTGWPSFWDPIDEKYIGTKRDVSLFGSVRTEVHCVRCDGHLGHVFPDGPIDKTGLRYCLNSAALDFKPNE